jgi:UDP-galactopyranose mutase
MFFTKKYDYLIVGAGLFGSVFARKMAEAGRKILVLEKNSHVAGHIYTKQTDNIHVHLFGPHIFHTNNQQVWEYVNKFVEFEQYKHLIKAKVKGKVYTLPFCLTTFNEFWGCTSPAEARQELLHRRVKIENPKNLEELALATVGEEIYQTLIYGYSKKQWGREPRKLPTSIISRLPVRFTFDTNYYRHTYQGIPKNGYTALVENILNGVEVRTNTDFFDGTEKSWRKIARKLIYSGPIDQLLDYEYGQLEYRTLTFKTMTTEGDFQGVAQMNYPEEKIAYTRTIEHKHFRPSNENPKSIVSFEYPAAWDQGKPRYYPVNDTVNNGKYEEYVRELQKQPDILVGGRTGCFRYMDMDETIAQSLALAEKELNNAN